jgi:hypothetical protein
MTQICRFCQRPLTEPELFDHVCGFCSFKNDLDFWDAYLKISHNPPKAKLTKSFEMVRNDMKIH